MELEPDRDPIPERIFKVSGPQKCSKCDRDLKGKLCYKGFDNKLYCRDLENNHIPLEIILCHFFTTFNEILKNHDVRITKDMIKKIERVFKNGLL